MGDETETAPTTAPAKPLGSISRVSIAPDKPTTRAKRTGTATKTKTTTKTTTQRGRRSGTVVGAPKRPYTRRIQVATSPASPIGALLKANGFSSAATIEVHEGRKRLTIPIGLLGS